jgi:hypothetical protein
LSHDRSFYTRQRARKPPRDVAGGRRGRASAAQTVSTGWEKKRDSTSRDSSDARARAREDFAAIPGSGGRSRVGARGRRARRHSSFLRRRAARRGAGPRSREGRMAGEKRCARR